MNHRTILFAIVPVFAIPQSYAIAAADSPASQPAQTQSPTQPASKSKFGSASTRPAASTEIISEPWYIVVLPNGSAHVQCGAREIYRCEAGSIDYAALQKNVAIDTAPRPQNTTIDQTLVTVNVDNAEPQYLLLKDKSDATGPFEQIRQAYRKDNNKPSTDLETFWKKYPPTPNSKKWDEP